MACLNDYAALVGREVIGQFHRLAHGWGLGVLSTLTPPAAAAVWQRFFPGP